METKETVYKEQGKFSKSVGAGMKSLLGGSGRQYYILEHKAGSEKHRIGEMQEIIIDYIELGRDPKCQVCFGQTFPTVSRRHCAITKENNAYIIRHLGKNPTLVNGRPVAKQWYLQNGDEIQLSVEGPKLGFLIPANPSVGTLGFTKRLSLFGKQALRPYKQAIMALVLILVLAISVMGYFIYKGNITATELVAQNKELVEKTQLFEGNLDSLNNQIQQSEGVKKRLVAEMSKLKEIMNTRQNPSYETGGTIPSPSFEPLYPSVYFILIDKLVIEYQGEKEEITDFTYSGTGFLLDDGRFVTARHIVEPWYFFDKEDATDVAMNKIVNNGGKITAYFTAYSPDRTSIKFTSSSFSVNRDADEIFSTTDNDGNSFVLRKAKISGGKDWAVANTNKTGKIGIDYQLSTNLKQQQKLHVLGYPLGLGVNSASDISPIYGSCIVSKDGLESGIILTTDRNFEHGNSGGPVFYLDNNSGRYIAVGIVSSTAGGSTGIITPISSIR